MTILQLKKLGFVQSSYNKRHFYYTNTQYTFSFNKKFIIPESFSMKEVNDLLIDAAYEAGIKEGENRKADQIKSILNIH